MADSSESDAKKFKKDDDPEIAPAKSGNSFPVDWTKYKCDNQKRGWALIFNQFSFKKSLQLGDRDGTHKDGEDLQRVLESCGFEVIPHEDLTRDEIIKEIRRVSALNHKECDYFVMAVMSHGGDNEIFAQDRGYPPEILWEPFIGNRCQSLAGKAKMFFINACRGGQLDKGVTLQHDNVETTKTYTLPIMSDLLIMYSSYQGYLSWRWPSHGSWFIQALCTELTNRSGEDDLLSILTRVNCRTALEEVCVDDKDKAKQICTIVSTLIKKVYF